jgi:hypothetical protein
MKTTLVTYSTAIALLLSGCGGTSDDTAVAGTTDITVERGPILGATVRDAKGQIGSSKGNGVYSFTNPTYPIESFGGYIDIDRDGTISAGDVAMNRFRLRTREGNVITLATTITENNATLAGLLEDGFSMDELLQTRPSLDIDNAALSDEVYRYCIENNISDSALLTDAQILTLRARIQTRKEAYNASQLDAATLEAELVNELGIATLTQDELTKLASTPMQNIINAIEPTQLTLEQKATLAYMWDEERMARDIYLTLNSLTPSQTLYNIATKAETQHAAAVEGLIEKYDLNIANTTDYSGGYSADILAGYSAGEYALSEIKNLYDALYAKGSASLQDALEVGCMVEVTDINDLDRDIEIAADAQDIVMIFENLRLGSYNHYWAFDRALKAQGVDDGCCVLGSEYCKTTQEYPTNDKMGAKH